MLNNYCIIIYNRRALYKFDHMFCLGYCFHIIDKKIVGVRFGCSRATLMWSLIHSNWKRIRYKFKEAEGLKSTKLDISKYQKWFMNIFSILIFCNLPHQSPSTWSKRAGCRRSELRRRFSPAGMFESIKLNLFDSQIAVFWCCWYCHTTSHSTTTYFS